MWKFHELLNNQAEEYHLYYFGLFGHISIDFKPYIDSDVWKKEYFSHIDCHNDKPQICYVIDFKIVIVTFPKWQRPSKTLLEPEKSAI